MQDFIIFLQSRILKAMMFFLFGICYPAACILQFLHFSFSFLIHAEIIVLEKPLKFETP